MNQAQPINTDNRERRPADELDQAISDVSNMLTCARDGLIETAPRAAETASYILDHALAIIRDKIEPAARPDPAPGPTLAGPLNPRPAKLAERITRDCPVGMLVSKRRLMGALETLNDVLVAADSTLEIQRGPIELVHEALHESTRPENIGN